MLKLSKIYLLFLSTLSFLPSYAYAMDNDRPEKRPRPDEDLSAQHPKKKAKTMGENFNEADMSVEGDFAFAQWIANFSDDSHEVFKKITQSSYWARRGGIPQDLKKSLELFRQADKHGNATTLQLGFCYQNGHAVEKNLTLAQKYYDKVIQSGNCDDGCPIRTVAQYLIKTVGDTDHIKYLPPDILCQLLIQTNFDTVKLARFRRVSQCFNRTFNALSHRLTIDHDLWIHRITGFLEFIKSISHLHALEITNSDLQLSIDKICKTLPTLNLIELRLSFVKLDSLGAYFVANICLNSIQILDLSHNKIDQSGFKFFGKLLKQNTSLLFLDLGYNLNADCLNGDDNEAEAVNYIWKALLVNKTLQSLRLCAIGLGKSEDSADFLGHMLGNNSTLTELDLSGNELDSNAVEALKEGITNNKGLKLLNLAGNYFDEESQTQLLEAQKTNNILQLELDDQDF